MAVGEEDQSSETGEEVTDPAGGSTEELGTLGTGESVPSWEDVKVLVEDGRITMVDGAAFRCASATADLYYAVSSVYSFVDRNSGCDLSLSSLPEGQIFADRLAAQRTEFLEILDKVLDSVRLRHETFMDAGNLIEEADNASAEGSSDLALTEFAYTPPSPPRVGYGASVIDEGAPWDPDPLFMDDFHVPSPATDPADVVTSHTDLQLQSTGFMNPTLLDPNASSYLMMYELGEYIRNNRLNEYSANLARSWGQVGIVLNNEIGRAHV